MNLLLVNDVMLEADTMAAEIRWKDFGIKKVFVAYSVEESKAVIRKEQIDILLCDIEMPGENGLDLIRWVNAQGYDIDSILLTCHADFTYARDAISLGCQDYLLLPAKYDDIGASVKKVCGGRIRRQEEERLQSYGKNWLIAHGQNSPLEGETPSYDADDVVEKCINFILTHISDENLSVSEISTTVYLSPIHLNRVFRRKKGINLSQWITKERMELASTLLLTTKLTANEVASRVGYRNYPYFSTVFKNYFGCAPSQYGKNK